MDKISPNFVVRLSSHKLLNCNKDTFECLSDSKLNDFDYFHNTNILVLKRIYIDDYISIPLHCFDQACLMKAVKQPVVFSICID